jgi:hypothetical protein
MKKWVTDVFAISAFIISTSLAVIRTVEFWNNRPRVKVLEDIVFQPEGPRGLRSGIEISALNKGHRPILIEKFGFTFRNGRSYIFGSHDSPSVRHQLPQRLQEFEKATVFINLGTFTPEGLRNELTRLGKDYWPPVEAFFKDALGKKYKKKLEKRVAYVTDEELAKHSQRLQTQ